MNRPVGLLLILALVLGAAQATADPSPPGLAVQIFGGLPINLPTTLEISQDGQPDISHEADWASKPWEQPLYWAVRVRWQRAGDGFEIQFLHHKLYLENPPATIQHFEVTHGFNILTANYMKRSRPVHWRVGAGVTMPNTFATVRGELSDVHDYSIAGPAFLAGAGTEFPLAGRFHLAVEGQFIAAWGKDEVAHGEARFTSLAFHLLAGLGFVF